MSEEQKDSASTKRENKLVRPALIASKYTVSEYSVFLRHLLVGLADESIPLVLVCPPGCDVDSIISPSVEIIRYPALDLPLLGLYNRKILIEQLAKFSPSVLHSLCEKDGCLGRQLAMRLDLPYVLTVSSLQRRFGQVYLSSRHLAKIITPTKSIASNIVEVYQRFSERIEQINVGTFVDETVGCFREPGRPANMVVAVPLRSTGELENLFSAVRHLAINRYEFMLVIMVAGRAERGLRGLLAELGLSQLAIIVPRLEPWRNVLAAADIFIQPVASRAFDPLLLEAMSGGTAVAACKGGVDDLIIEGQTGVIFDGDDELSIRGALQRLLDRREWARQLAKAGQQYLRKNHTVSKMVAATLQSYRDAMQWYGG